VRAAGEPAPTAAIPPAGPLEVERLSEVAAPHGIEILGPPPEPTIRERHQPLAGAAAGRVHSLPRGCAAMPYAEVAVLAEAPFHQAFTYRVPDGIRVAPGAAVLVPFGRRVLTGVVLAVGEQGAYEGSARAVLAAGEPLLLPHQVELARWLAQRYLAPVSACVALMLPPDAARRLAETVEWLGGPVPGEGLSPADTRLAERLARSGRATVAALRRAFGGGADAAVERLVLAGLARRRLTLPPPAPVGPLPVPSATPPPTLTPAQAEAVAAITVAMERSGPAAFLLFGVTGSGKTEVYLAAVAAARARGRRAIVLVPEIALTPQTVARFAARFPGEVAVSHSGLSSSQRYRQWHEVHAGRATVVVGARSALFLPQPSLGLIVVDEEHEWSYKQQDPPPRYHARDVALKLAALTGAVVVLGSATPDVVSYWRAEQGRYHLLRLPERVGGGDGVATDDAEHHPAREAAPATASLCRPTDGAAPPPGGGPGPGLPSVTVVDLAAELRAGNRGIFSRMLEEALAETLRRGEQAILYLNRRGNASFLLCRDCGYVPRCSGCLVPFTYHAGSASSPGDAGAGGERGERLRCHHCNRQRRVPARCPRCGGARIRFLGLGTQRVEEEVRQRFPGARVLRWDRDSARSAAAHEALLHAFAAHEADVLVGTQMIAKGLDLPRVTLVGVVNADIALHRPDFRAGERAFQLLTQVAGRAGRGERPGRVIIQTYSPRHYAVQAAARHDYEALYRAEIDLRRRAGYPPFGRLARLVFAHTNAAYAQQEARRLAQELDLERRRRGIPGAQVVGPAPALFERLRGRWRWQILLRAADPAELLAAVTLPRGWQVDVDPVTLQ
jgi:primosomal protein N' (replication factor Y)